MLITLPVPARPRQDAGEDPLAAYEKRFGALPEWFAEVSRSSTLALARQALRNGVPLTAADHMG